MTHPHDASPTAPAAAECAPNRKRIHSMSLDIYMGGLIPNYPGVWFNRTAADGTHSCSRYNDLTATSFLRATRLLRHLGREAINGN